MFLTLGAIRALERDSLQAIGRIGEFGEFGALVNLAQNYRTILAGPRGPINLAFKAIMSLKFRGDTRAANTRRAVYVGALVEPAADGVQIARSSYSLTVCNGERRRAPILRKLHFDYEPGHERAAGECKPSMHIQVCGELMPLLIEEGYTTHDLRAWTPSLEKPRIPSMPTSLALVLNWLMLEFEGDPTAARVLRNPEWKNLVTHAERTVLGPFFSSSAAFFAARGKNANVPFVQTQLYEMVG